MRLLHPEEKTLASQACAADEKDSCPSRGHFGERFGLMPLPHPHPAQILGG